MDKILVYLAAVVLAVYSKLALAGGLGDTISMPMPEPGTISLLALGVGAIAVVSRWRGRK